MRISPLRIAAPAALVLVFLGASAAAQESCSEISGDVDGTSSVNMTDAIYLLNYLFRGGPEPVGLCCPKDLGDCRQALAALQAELAACCQVGSRRPGPLPRTGQVKCCNTASPPVCVEDCSGVLPAGQDAAYKAGCVAEPRFIDNGDGTISDTCTGLMWQRDTAPGTYSWEAALIYAENSSLAQRSDWRIPSVLELQSMRSTRTSSRTQRTRRTGRPPRRSRVLRRRGTWTSTTASWAAGARAGATA